MLACHHKVAEGLHLWVRAPPRKGAVRPSHEDSLVEEFFLVPNRLVSVLKNLRRPRGPVEQPEVLNVAILSVIRSWAQGKH